MENAENYLNFNVNHDFYVKLEEKGYRFWKKEAEEWVTSMPEIPPCSANESSLDYKKRAKRYKEYRKYCRKLAIHPLSWYKKKADKKRYVSFQMWQFVEIFGKYTTLGAESIYNTNILIKESDLTPVK